MSKKARNKSFYYDGKKKCWKKDNINDGPIPEPNHQLVEEYLKEWNENEDYRKKEDALNTLFTNVYQHNENLSEVLIKVCVLNDFYSTNIYNILVVSNIIVDMKLDSYFQANEKHYDKVDELNMKIYERTKKRGYSFATKYFSHQRPDDYPIYDYYVDMMLCYYKDDENNEFTFDGDLVNNYVNFCKTIENFKKVFKLEKVSVKVIDKMLWQMGKKYFPRYAV